jgi:hypothetical protein
VPRPSKALIAGGLPAGRRTGAAAAAILLAVAVVGAACGGDESAAEPPALAKQVGRALAERANEVAKRLEDGRRCAAADDVRELREVAERQAANDRIPAELREPLLTGVDALLGRIDCVERVTETVTVPAEPEILTTTTTAPQEEGGDEGSGGSEAPAPSDGDGGGGPPGPPEQGTSGEGAGGGGGAGGSQGGGGGEGGD